MDTPKCRDSSHAGKQSNMDSIIKLPTTSPVPYLFEELWEVEDRPIVEDRIIEDVGQHPRKGVGGTCGRQLLPTKLQAEAGIVQTADSQCELQQVVLTVSLIPPPL